ncbi:GSCOCG00001246001-RA-CDS [Cotesia congregata]|uniref:Similar to eef1b: Elongation factor 1-beta (Xenopus laevis) n=1 Tax=Cotesia congregata TaxID=51543 RepID=A0A8J2HFW3_COTCN|nr:GSCOCG00001246001-RA-CDS [Cotesia congregata]CAG5097375.1 Similar to eef1b: Elongation factor 1-beta (Xenopus laevis) [Cotesia congregata]
MAIGDLKSPKGLKDLDTFLAERSYVEGWQASQADVAVLEALGQAPTASNPHVLRWYTHIKSHELAKLPGTKKIPSSLGVASSGSAPAAAKPADDDDDIDLFGSDDEEDAEAERIKAERVKAYAEKKSKKPALIAKSSIVLDVKPWDDETNMQEIEEKVRAIVMDGLVWGASKLVPVCHGINKLQIMCVVEDDKVSVDLLTEMIQEFEDHVQSVDIAAFNKI